MANVRLHPPGEAQAASPAPVETPTQQVVKAANELKYATDARGRTIGWRKLSALEDFDLTEIAGATASNNDWMVMATIAFGVREIDGQPVPRPANKNQLRAIVARLDHDGMQAILGLFQPPEKVDEVEEAVRNEMDRAKN